MNELQKRAIRAGLTFKQAIGITDIALVIAIERGATFEEVFLFSRITLAAIVAGATIKQAHTFKNIYQVEALRSGTPYPKALKYNTASQIKALRESNFKEPATQLLLTNPQIKETINTDEILSNSREDMENDQPDVPAWALKAWAVRAGATQNQASKFTRYVQIKALQAGATPEEALVFSNSYQVSAKIIGADYKTALRFTNQCQIIALYAGVPAALALEFTNDIQILALKAGADVNQALMFTDEWQTLEGTDLHELAASRDYYTDEAQMVTTNYEQPITLQQLLTFTNDYQIEALQGGFSYEEAITITSKGQLDAIKENQMQYDNEFESDDEYCMPPSYEETIINRKQIGDIATRDLFNRKKRLINSDSENNVLNSSQCDESSTKYCCKDISGDDGSEHDMAEENQECSNGGAGQDDAIDFKEGEAANKQKPIEALESKSDSLFKLAFSGLYAALEILKEFNAPKDIPRQIEKRIEMAEENTCKISIFGASSIDFIKDGYQYSYENELKPSANEELIDTSLIFNQISGDILPMMHINNLDIIFG